MENLHTAIPMDSSNTLSEQKFQEMLNYWLEEKGVLSDLRSQLRFKMINALKDSTIGRDIHEKSCQRLSLSKQVINLIVAEFLMRNKCYYSLSVFNTEVSLTHTLPEGSIIFDSGRILRTVGFHLDKENILNIMELIGLNKSSKYCQEIISQYFNELENNSLLICIINLLRNFINENDRMCNTHVNGNGIDLNVEDTFTKQIGDILKMSGLTGKSLKTVIESIQKFCETEKNRTEDRFSQIINELKTDIHNQEQQIKELLKTNKVLKSQISKEKRDRKKLKLHTKKMLLKERLSKKNNEGKNNISHKKSQFRNNLVENNSISNFSSAVQKQSVQQCHLQHCNEVCNENRRVVDNLNKQNRTLTEDNEQQKEQIKKLTSKYKQLSSEFTDCQNRIILLNCKMNEENSEDIFFSVPYEELHIYPDNLKNNVGVSDTNSYNLTEDILHQTHLRLRQLEEETKTIEQKCQRLKLSNEV